MPTYPLTLPSSIAPKSSTMSLSRAVAVVESPFTGKTRAYSYDKAVWKATVTYPPMSNKQAGEFRSFLMNLKGRLGTFKMGDPDRLTPLGRMVTSGNVSSGSMKFVMSAAAVGDEELTGNWFQYKSGWPLLGVDDALYAGDMVSINNQLYMITEDVSTLSNYSPTFSIQPPLKSAITANQVVDFEVPQYGIWRMDSNDLGWDSDHVKKHGISFSCTEAI